MLKDYTLEDISTLLATHYSLSPTITALGGYTDRNYLLTDPHPLTSLKLILKISSNLQNHSLIQMQNYVLRKLPNQLLPNCCFPKVMATSKGEDMVVVEQGGEKNYFRVLSYIEGKEMWDFKQLPDRIFEEVGELTAKLATELESITQNEYIQQLAKLNSSQKYCMNLMNYISVYNSKKQYLDEDILDLVQSVTQDFLALQSTIKQIPEQLLHNDICLSNLLIDQDITEGVYLSGLIDFSSLIYGPRIIELVLPCARSNLDELQPLKNIFLIIKAYKKHRKLTDQQLTVLYPLIKTRLAFLCLISCEKTVLNKESEYVRRCKEGHVRYLKIISQASTNSQFQQLIRTL